MEASRRSVAGALVGSLVMAAAMAVPAVGARAQTRGAEVRIDQLQPSSPFSPFTRAEGPHHRFSGGVEYAVRVTADYAWSPLVVEVESDDPAQSGEAKPVAHALLLHMAGAISPIDWLNVELEMPFALFEQGETAASVPREPVLAGEGGVGDFRFGAHLRPIASRAFDLSVGIRVWDPTGSEAAYLAGPSRHARFELVGAGAGEHESLVYGCTMAMAPLLFAGRDGDRMALSCAAHLRVTPAFAVGVEPHLALFVYAPEEDRASTGPGIGDGTDLAVALESLAALRLDVDGFGLGVAAGPGLGGAPGTAAARGLLTLSYAARAEHVEDEAKPKDTDLDGIADDYDACPEEAGSKTRRGCPTREDEDGDGFAADDACPRAPGPPNDNPKANGCPDRDNDHVPDPVDDCPIEPSTGPDGCPQYARLTGATGPGLPDFRVTPAIRFASKLATLSPEGVAALGEIAATLLANPKLEQVSVTIGARDAPGPLTDARARAVLDALSGQNLHSNRYEVVLSEDLAAGEVRVRIVR